jgi:hypothetical protein
MNDISFLAANLNAVNGVNGFNETDTIRPQNENLDEISLESRDENLTIDTDSVELSVESLNLARFNDNVFLDQLKLNDSNSRTLTDTEFANLAGNTEGTIINFNTVSDLANATGVEINPNGNIQNFEVISQTGTNTNQLNTNANGNEIFRTTPTQAEGERSNAFEAVAEAENAAGGLSGNNPSETPVDASFETSSDRVAGSSDRETGSGARERNLNEENPDLLEVQANQLARSNAVLNTLNGFTPEAPNPEAATAPENPRNQQNIILQNVGSQMAQAIPPPNIISLIG